MVKTSISRSSKRNTWFVTDNTANKFNTSFLCDFLPEKSISSIILVIYSHPQGSKVNLRTKWPKYMPFDASWSPICSPTSLYFAKLSLFKALRRPLCICIALITSPVPFNTSTSLSRTYLLSRHPLTHLLGLLTPFNSSSLIVNALLAHFNASPPATNGFPSPFKATSSPFNTSRSTFNALW